MNPIKKAFSKIKEDIQFLKNEVLQLKLQIKYIQTNPTHTATQTTQQTDKQTNTQTNPTQILTVDVPYGQNLNTSIGNNGVPTNKQTNKQTNTSNQNTHSSEFKQAKKILESLDNIKKEIRLKFKDLTSQEMLVFSTIYAMEEEDNVEITYRILANQINLSESSIRDYTNKLIKKGIPIEKIRQNNKIIILKISQDLKNIATLSTIQNLREL